MAVHIQRLRFCTFVSPCRIVHMSIVVSVDIPDTSPVMAPCDSMNPCPEVETEGTRSFELSLSDRSIRLGGELSFLLFAICLDNGNLDLTRSERFL